LQGTNLKVFYDSSVLAKHRQHTRFDRAKELVAELSKGKKTG
jgi:hypothetical protein